LRWPEGHRCFFPALRAVSSGLSLRVGVSARWTVRCGAYYRHSLALAVFAAFGFVLELFIVEKQLFTRGEHEIRTTIDTLQNLVLVFHWRGAPISRPCSARETRIGKDPVHNVGRRFTSPSVLTPGLGPPCSVHRMVTALLTCFSNTYLLYFHNLVLLPQFFKDRAVHNERPVFP
jgi:hypothetical protein